jgi:threonine dehydrogenase-like Zn-dependent dehydrogenase
VASGRCGCHGYKATAGWRFGNLIDGTQAEYVLASDAQANLTPLLDGLTDEQVLIDVVAEVTKHTDGRGADAAIEALGLQSTFEQSLRVIKPGGTLSSLGAYSSDMRIPLDAWPSSPPSSACHHRGGCAGAPRALVVA